MSRIDRDINLLAKRHFRGVEDMLTRRCKKCGIVLAFEIPIRKVCGQCDKDKN